MINAYLVEGRHTDQMRSNDFIDVLYCFLYTLAAITMFITVAEFKRGGSSFQDRLATLRGTTTAPAVSSADDDNQPL